MRSRILAVLNIRPGEEKNIFLMLVHYFFMGGAMLFVQSASLALFFEVWDTTAMPYIYLDIAIIVSSVTALFLKIAERTSLARFLVLCVLFLLIGTIAFRTALAVTNSKWLMLALPIWSQTLVNISVMVFWTLWQPLRCTSGQTHFRPGRSLSLIAFIFQIIILRARTADVLELSRMLGQ